MTSRRARVIALSVVLVALVAPLVAALSAMAQPAAAEVSPPTPRGRVLIIAAPRLTWSTVDVVRPPNLMKLFARSAVALCSTRTAGSVTRPGDAYLTIGAGNRMGTVGDVDGLVVERTEAIIEGDPTALYQRTTGVTPKRPILAIGKPAIDRFNDEEQLFGAKAGSLAQALNRTHRTMAVIANADRQFGNPQYRQAGLAAMDAKGQVADGMVSSELLRADDHAAFGLAFDPAVFTSEFDAVWAHDDVVLVELSDLERADVARSSSTPEQGDREYARALLAGDKLVGHMLKGVDLQRDTVMVVGATPPAAENQLTVFAQAGPDVATGWATSGTTRRDGYVTLTDIAPSVLHLQGATVPAAMNDTPLSAHADAETLTERTAAMIDRSERSIVRDRAFGPTTVVFIVVLVIDLVLAVLCLARLPKLSGVVRGLALAVLAAPPVTFLLGLVPIKSPGLLGAAVAVGALVVATLASMTRRIDPCLPPVTVLSLLWGVLAIDIATGGDLQINTIFGYSPIVAGRFSGFGNQAFSMIAVVALLLASIAVEHLSRGKSKVGRATIVGVAVWFLVTVVLDGHPSMGSDVGGVLAFVPAATIALVMFAGIKVRARLVAAIAGGTIAILAVFAVLDLSRPTDDQTHLGRFVAKLFEGDAGTIIERKIAANLRVLTSVWAWVIPVALVYFMYLTWRPNHTLQRLNREHSQFRTFGVSGLTLGVLAMALNDSGVTMPAMMLALVAAFVSYHVVALESVLPGELLSAGTVSAEPQSAEPQPPEPAT